MRPTKISIRLPISDTHLLKILISIQIAHVKISFPSDEYLYVREVMTRNVQRDSVSALSSVSLVIYFEIFIRPGITLLLDDYLLMTVERWRIY